MYFFAMDKTRIISINTRGLRNRFKRNAMFTLFKQQRFDIICLQETHVTEKEVALWEKQWGGQLFYSSGSQLSKGEIILISKHFKGKVTQEQSRSRVLIISCETENLAFTVANIYAPNVSSEKIRFFKSLQTLLKEFESRELLVMGDFNTTIDSNFDNISGNPHAEKERDSLKETLKKLNLTDIWRALNEERKEFTWCRYNPFIARRIDYCFLSEDIVSRCVSCNILTVPHTDHRGVVTELCNTDFIRGPGYWRFNNSYLKDKQFVEKMNKLLSNLVAESGELFESSQSQWDWCKLKIKDFCIEYGKYKARKRTNEMLDFQSKLQKFEEQLVKDNNNEEIQKEIINLKTKIEVISMEKARGAQVRARAKWIQEGEKNTKYFLGLEKQRANSNLMTHVKNDNGVIINSQMDVLNEQVKFYSTLYQKTDNAIEIEDMMSSYLQGEAFPKLDKDEADSCEGLMNEEETSVALSSMKNGSSPGNDGLSVEFYKFFWGRVKTVVTLSFNEAFGSGEISYTQKQGVIILLHKGKELSRDNLANWRPITLTNVDYKILAKVLAKRLSLVIGKLINQDQVGYLKGRNIASVIRTIDDVINYMNVTKKGGYLLALDYKKAFDSISKNFMLEALKSFGFGGQFIQWVRIILSNTISMINHGGWISEPFAVNSGIRQGCPFSPLAFVLAVELLAIKIRNSTIAGISLPPQNGKSEKLKIKQLADDTTLFLNNKDDMVLVSEIVKEFSKFSGLELNVNKTRAMCLGNKIKDNNLPYTITDKLKILGIYFKKNESAINIEENWSERITQMNKMITRWSKRDLGILGKVVVTKCFILSQFIFVMQSIGLPEKVLTNINRTLYRFIWQRKKTNRKAFEKIKRKVMESEVSKGGVNMVNIKKMQESFYMQWLGKLFAVKDENWTYIPKWLFDAIASNANALDLNCRSKTLIKEKVFIESPFWQAALNSHLDSKPLHTHKDINKDNFRMQIIWNNINIQYKGKTLFFHSWKRAGIERINDIIKHDDKRLLNLNEIIEKIGRNQADTIFKYNALTNAIPILWKQYISEISHEEVHQQHIFDPIRYCAKPKEIMKMLRQQENDNEKTKTCAEGFWLRKFNVVIDKSIWLTAHSATKETRLRELHWKIIHNIYPTNILLQKMKVTDDNKCSICRDEIDYLEHFFFFCPPVKQFWLSIERFLQTMFGIRTELSVCDVLFGIANLNLDGKNEIMNHIILIGKMCISIYKKCNANGRIFLIFQQQMKYRESAQLVYL